MSVENGQDRITVRIPEAVRMTGLSRSRIYELIRSGDIRSVKIGASRLIPVDSLHDFIRDRLQAPSDA